MGDFLELNCFMSESDSLSSLDESRLRVNESSFFRNSLLGLLRFILGEFGASGGIDARVDGVDIKLWGSGILTNFGVHFFLDKHLHQNTEVKIIAAKMILLVNIIDQNFSVKTWFASWTWFMVHHC